jgi:hypothetical protein
VRQHNRLEVEVEVEVEVENGTTVLDVMVDAHRGNVVSIA